MTKPTGLRELFENIWQVTDDVDLCYSEWDDDETGKGWFLQSFQNKQQHHSRSFPTWGAALKHFKVMDNDFIVPRKKKVINHKIKS